MQPRREHHRERYEARQQARQQRAWQHKRPLDNPTAMHHTSFQRLSCTPQQCATFGLPACSESHSPACQYRISRPARPSARPHWILGRHGSSRARIRMIAKAAEQKGDVIGQKLSLTKAVSIRQYLGHGVICLLLWIWWIRAFGSSQAMLIYAANLIIWDELPMANRAAVEAVDTLLQNLKDSNLPFRGVLFLGIGDFRLVAPVVKNQYKTGVWTAQSAPLTSGRSSDYCVFMRQSGMLLMLLSPLGWIRSVKTLTAWVQ